MKARMIWIVSNNRISYNPVPKGHLIENLCSSQQFMMDVYI